MKRGHNFRELKIWKEAISVVKEVYILSSDLPETEKYGLKSQMNRAAVSVPSNIDVGTGRSSEKEFIHFLRIAVSSTYELETQLVLVEELFEISTDEIRLKLNNLHPMIGAFIRSLQE